MPVPESNPTIPDPGMAQEAEEIDVVAPAVPGMAEQSEARVVNL